VHSPRYQQMRAVVDDSGQMGKLNSVSVNFFFSGDCLRFLTSFIATVGLCTTPVLKPLPPM